MDDRVAGETVPQRQLRLGLLLSSTTLPRWQVDVLDALESVDGVEFVVTVLDEGAHVRPTTRELWGRRRLAWTVFNRVSARNCAALAPVDCRERLAAAPQVAVVPRPPSGWQEFDDDSLARIAEHRPDALLRLGFNLLRGGVLSVAPLGVWSFHHGDERVQRGGPPCFWELVFDDAETGVLLQRLTERLDGGIPLARGSFPTQRHSYARNREQAYLGSALVAAQAARRYVYGDPSFVDAAPSGSDAPIRTPPGWRVLATLLPRLVARWFDRQRRGIFAVDQWRVGIVDQPIEEFVAFGNEAQGWSAADSAGPATTVDAVSWFPLCDRRTRYLADPFGIPAADGTGVVLVEDYDHSRRHGVVSAVHLDADGLPDGEPTPVGRFDVHASYPFTFRTDGFMGRNAVDDGAAEWWCVPERGQAHDVIAVPAALDGGLTPVAATADSSGEELAAGSPGVTTLVGERLVDPTVFRWAGVWWLFGTDPSLGANTVLRAWWTEKLGDPWHRHAIDPLVVSASEARPAGTPFVVDGRLVRPAQVCARRYGEAVALMEVVTLSPTDFVQRRVGTLRPDPAGPCPDGFHTVSAFGERTLVDGVREIPSVVRLRHELRARAGRRGGVRS